MNQFTATLEIHSAVHSDNTPICVIYRHEAYFMYSSVSQLLLAKVLLPQVWRRYSCGLGSST